MPRLLHDRYLLLTDQQACDMATGEVVTIDAALEPAAGGEPTLPALAEVLDHGRDGCPRAVAADVRAGTRWKTVASRVAVDAVARGYVAMSVDVYRRFAPLLGDEIRERALVLIADERNRPTAGRALVDAAARAPRPHVLLTLRSRAVPTHMESCAKRVPHTQALRGPGQPNRFRAT